MSWWMGRTTRTVSDTVPAAVADVRTFYVDLHNLAQVHPLVAAVTVTAYRAAAEGGYVRTYRVADRIPFGPLTLRTRYHVTMQVPAHGEVIAESHQFPGVRLRTTVSFEPQGAATRVTERMQISAPRPLLALTVREAVAAHTAMLAGIGNVFQ